MTRIQHNKTEKLLHDVSKTSDYSFQKTLISKTEYNLQKYGKSVLAATCGAGKTSMACRIIKNYLKSNPSAKVAFVGHNQVCIRDNAANSFKENGLAHVEVIKSQDFDRKSNVYVTLPGAIAARTKKNEFGLIVVDEAHHYFLNGETHKRIQKTNPKAQILCLTASHGEFSALGWPIVAFSLEELVGHGCATLWNNEILIAKDDWADSLSADGNLSDEYEFEQLDVIVAEALKKVIKSIGPKKSKTLVTCNGTATARDVYRLIDATKRFKGKVRISTADTDPKNQNLLDEFVNNQNCEILVVVYRGILGFNLPQLETIVDLSGTTNTDRIFQLIGRVVRPYEGKKSLYIKLSPEADAGRFELAVHKALALCYEINYKYYKGKPEDVKMPMAPSKPGTDKKPRYPLPSAHEIGRYFRQSMTERGEAWVYTAKDLMNSMNGNNAKENKEKLLELARKGPRLNKTHPLKVALHNYTDKNSGCYDPEFRAKIMKIAPHWFRETRVETKKEKLRALAKAGFERRRLSDSLENALCYYLRKDPVFRSAIEKSAPRWVREPLNSEKNMKKMLIFMRKTKSFPKEKKKFMGYRTRYPKFKEITNLLIEKFDIPFGRAATRRREIRNMDTGKVFLQIKDAVEKYDISQGNISACLSGKRKTAGGYRWAYVD